MFLIRAEMKISASVARLAGTYFVQLNDVGVHMPLQYVKHESISLKGQPDFSEVWLHEQICTDTAILGLGELTVIERERVQLGGGRLDMLLSDSESGVRYEVELMLGPTDPSHIIRTIEYWDNERRRYPAYDHIAVIVAEQVTARFLHVIGLFAGSIPIIAIQLNVLKVGDKIVLNFVKVLDQRQLRVDDEEGGGEDEPDVDRSTWEIKVGVSLMKICDQVAQMANEIADPKLVLKYKKGHVALCVPGSFFNVLAFNPKKSFMSVRFPVADPQGWITRLTEAGIDAELKRHGTRVLDRLRSAELEQHQELLRELIHQCVKDKIDA